MHSRWLVCLLLAACADEIDVDVEDGEDEAFGGKADSLQEGAEAARAVLALVNDPQVTAEVLDTDVGVSARIASAVVAGRPFHTLRALDAVPYVGPETLARFLAYATAHGYVHPERIISRSGASAYESEPWIAASADGKSLASVWTAPLHSGDWPGGDNGAGDGAIGYAFSRDGGETWSEPATMAFPGLVTPVNTKVAADARGGFWAVYLGRDNNLAEVNDAIVVAHSADATSFGAPVPVTEAAPPATDGNKVWYDLPAIISHRGTAIAAYAYNEKPDPDAPCMGTQVARSEDGVSWTRTNVGQCAALRNDHALCASETDDHVYLVTAVGAPEKPQIVLDRSDDEGRTFGHTLAISTPEEPGVHEPSITCSVDAKGGVWVAYGVTQDPFAWGQFAKLSKIRVAHITGTTIERFDAIDTAAAMFAMHPNLVVDRSGGVNVLYHAGDRDDDVTASLRWTRMAPGAYAFSPSTAIAGPLRFDQNWGVAPFFGDYFGIAVAGESLTSAYAIRSGDDLHVGFRRWSLSSPSRP